MNSQLSLAVAQTRQQDMLRAADARRLAAELPSRSFAARLCRPAARLSIARRRTAAQPA